MSNNRQLWLRVGLAYLAFILIGANDGAFGVILPSLQSFYNVDKSTVSIVFLFGTAGFLSSAFSSGPMVHKLGTRKFLTIGPGLFIIGAAGMASAISFPVTLVSSFIMSYGVGILDAGLNTYIAGLPNNTGLLNYLHAFYGVGALIGPIVASGFLAAALRWNWVYVVWLAVSLPLMFAFWVFMRGEKQTAHEEGTHGGGNLLASALKLRTVWLAAFFLLLYVGGEVTMGNWSFSLLTEDRGQAALLAGWTVSGFWLGLTLGRVVLGGLARRIGDKNLIQVCLVGVLAGLLLVWLPPASLGGISTVTGIVGLWLTGFSFGPIFPTTIAVMSRLVPARLLPTSIGFLGSGGSAGAAFFPWIAGILAQGVGLWVILPYVIGISVLMLLCWLALQATPAAQASHVGAESQGS